MNNVYGKIAKAAREFGFVHTNMSISFVEKKSDCSVWKITGSKGSMFNVVNAYCEVRDEGLKIFEE